jgi:hypothetical protein
VRPAVESEKLGIPSAVIITTGFTTAAQLAAKSWGIENLRLAEYPGAIGIHSPAEMAEKLRTVVLDRIVDSLTGNERGSAATGLSMVASAGKTVFSGTFDGVNKFFCEQEWTDGLPIVPPSRERVDEFLKYTSRAADEQIAILAPAKLKATPRNIAANAIMAGCSPSHLPVIIAAVEALSDENYNLNNIGSSSGISPFIIVNGPVVEKLGIECGGQLISKGPNPAIGRAIGLIVRNIAGYRPGKNYMGSFGYPLVLAFAENEKESPWDAFHVERGYGKGSSTVTVGVTNNWGHAPAPASGRDISGAQITLDVLCREIAKKVRVYESAETVMITVLVSPPVARSLADAGYSKQAVKEYLFENAQRPLRDFIWARKYTGGGKGANTGASTNSSSPDEMTRLLASPDVVQIVVCGDPHRNRVMVLEGGHAIPATREINCYPD